MVPNQFVHLKKLPSLATVEKDKEKKPFFSLPSAPYFCRPIDEK